MTITTAVLITIIALLHFYFLILEMFFWDKPKGIKAFKLESQEFAKKTKVLAANQGLYNGFLAAGLLFSIFESNLRIASFFLFCIFIAGIYGFYSTKNKVILFVQALPAILVFLFFTFF
ncbi:DUF1304 domain-containing protein [Tamlana sp. 2_MG-2023]|uniref:DUF1304 domain-containing protein n=1 Tax=unclassified Tamlana TaxID=2614803 RepID=UPI0026E2D423|nr:MULTISPECIES: DUF1304 domain-containing protein [unclassified Tamlana]MDO6761018.1 DUF1304 domain-containing protein [Tamlana sp. 2_MG-2023]MDO6791649.1 DUF1304 domain-containing protein [Tamlana sp. 1_MG-2023]